jgi:hypothetical protein
MLSAQRAPWINSLALGGLDTSHKAMGSFGNVKQAGPKEK